MMIASDGGEESATCVAARSLTAGEPLIGPSLHWNVAAVKRNLIFLVIICHDSNPSLLE